MLPCIQGLILPVQASYDHEKFEQQLQFFHLKHYFRIMTDQSAFLRNCTSRRHSYIRKYSSKKLNALLQP